MTASKKASKSPAGRHAKHLTLRNVPPEVTSLLAEEARRLGTSQNAMAVDLLRRGLGLSAAPYDNGLAAHAGDWSKKDLAEFERATRTFEAIDEELWR